MAIPATIIEDLIKKDAEHKCPPKNGFNVCVKIQAVATLPSRFGDFQIVAFYNDIDHKEHVAIIQGEVNGKEDVPVRLHSECLTGDALGSLRCDCRDQLETSLRLISKLKSGIILYLRQEGRGIGLVNKLKAYQLQDAGLDTVDANKILGFADDERDYDVAAHMLRSLGVKSVKLMTNNPKKINDLRYHGVKITGRLPIQIQANKHNEKYLKTKKEKLGHLLDERNLEQVDDLLVEK